MINMNKYKQQLNKKYMQRISGGLSKSQGNTIGMNAAVGAGAGAGTGLMAGALYSFQQGHDLSTGVKYAAAGALVGGSIGAGAGAAKGYGDVSQEQKKAVSSKWKI